MYLHVFGKDPASKTAKTGVTRGGIAGASRECLRREPRSGRGFLGNGVAYEQRLEICELGSDDYMPIETIVLRGTRTVL
ncbi:hypothetical protein ILYODFUR_016356 [Ilyodon furcidens]|uniref:Uncharacterized protein n=1 Tax=Ilyodon furcidens TaxID=33524 RepID=A0ABV0UH06_9TELE